MTLSRSVKMIMYIIAALLIIAGIGMAAFGAYKKGYRTTDPTTKAKISIWWIIMFYGGIVLALIGVIVLLFAVLSKTTMMAKRVSATTYDSRVVEARRRSEM
jgi:TRAP-type C4-dicarboxylate transport system permease small subunit